MPSNITSQKCPDVHDLTGADFLVRLIGYDDTVRLLEEARGERIYIPKKRMPSKGLCGLQKILSPGSISALSEVLGGNYYRVPFARRFMITHYHDMGMKPADIVRRVGVTRAWVGKVIQGVERGNQRLTKKAA
ncbi:hypothetical protein [Komagataeibacter sp. FNDCF1]|uniref:hypothetical protein n=1 Tax=Komagataeibacter sp. FNDCF1 TaxID=2878681 RepID=UPI001E65246B|nr:hypothetical protein [Komagataeibacter sp. FNDCF1]MCE2564645.1 hypothetical protein [Komagataeibacter sp. FNDCF1]